ncbi:LysM peptidoglycan-binding domain-containing protein [Paenibacillus sp. PsM32]|uniref:LysM peptidoglycan-binding domain-containing protein n=1 Tax=Paenibacillus sp. PsM32 TaxID=3030536 RepID=UPI00263AD2E2|nr:LysM peptidoglycan-binding domain-containing protein [Paenibacillus sp. PsM32]MDN4617195.1 LysM peptidoglycan-binding domain-containing protein [Paenibacillus sp. PsM32]
MDIFLIDGKRRFFHFPVNPEEISISRSKGYETVNMLQYGEFDFVQGDKVKEISFSSFFPKEYNPSYCQYKNIPAPNIAINKLNELLISDHPMQLMITTTGINVPIYLISFNSSFKGGEPGDISFDLTFRTWRDAKVKQKKTSKNGKTTNKSGSRADLKTSNKSYTVKSGDSLSKIAKLELGDSSKWNDIYKLNTKLIGANPNQIKPGQKLVMPT